MVAYAAPNTVAATGTLHNADIVRVLDQVLTPADMLVLDAGKRGRLVQETYANKIYARDVGNVRRSAIQVTTASGICAALDLLANEGYDPAFGARPSGRAAHRTPRRCRWREWLRNPSRDTCGRP